MDDHYSDRRSDQLILEWDASVFFPELESLPITETLKIDHYSTDAEKAYWSVPEHLVDIMWARSRIGQREIHKDDFEDYITLEFKLHRIVSELWKIISVFDSDSDTIIEERKLAAKWLELKQVRNTLIQPLADNPIDSFTETEIRQIIDIANQLKDAKYILDERGKALARIAKDVSKIEEYDDQANRGKIKKLAKKLCGMMDDPEWQKESTAEKNVEQIIQTITNFKGETWRPDGVEWSQRYLRSVREGILETAHIVCDMVNSKADTQYWTMTAIMDKVDKVLKNMSKNSAPEALKDYMSDKRRCIALLEIHNANKIAQYMAFSGFLDCCGYKNAENDAIMKGYKDICNAFHCELVTMSPSVRRSISRYGLNECLELVECGSLCKECGGSDCGHCDQCKTCKENHDKNRKDKDKSRLHSRYSCCERKIITYLQQSQNTTIDSAIMHVKFEPCLSCYGALKIWKKGIKDFALDYIPFQI